MLYNIHNSSYGSDVGYFALGPHTVTCNICYGEYEEDEMQIFGQCQHDFCKTCMRQHVLACANSLVIPACPEHLCEEKIDLDG